jgi:hypothetical protein
VSPSRKTGAGEGGRARYFAWGQSGLLKADGLDIGQ